MTAREAHPATARETLDRAMSEAEWQKQVIEYAEMRGWACYHTHDSRRSQAGYPDLTLCRLSRILFVELKSAKGRVTREQAVWLNALEGTGKCECHLWRPSDWPAIQEELL